MQLNLSSKASIASLFVCGIASASDLGVAQPEEIAQLFEQPTSHILGISPINLSKYYSVTLDSNGVLKYSLKSEHKELQEKYPDLLAQTHYQMPAVFTGVTPTVDYSWNTGVSTPAGFQSDALLQSIRELTVELGTLRQAIRSQAAFSEETKKQLDELQEKVNDLEGASDE